MLCRWMSEPTSNFDNVEFPTPKRTFVRKVVKKYMLGIFISESGGSILYPFQISPQIREDLVSSFISALAMFGEENVGKIRRVFIEGLDVEMSIYSKHDLILTVIFKPNMVQDHLDEEMEHTLDLFNEKYSKELKERKLNQALYRKFDSAMVKIITDYFLRIEVLKEDHMFSHLFSFKKD